MTRKQMNWPPWVVFGLCPACGKVSFAPGLCYLCSINEWMRAECKVVQGPRERKP